MFFEIIITKATCKKQEGFEMKNAAIYLREL